MFVRTGVAMLTLDGEPIFVHVAVGRKVDGEKSPPGKLAEVPRLGQ